MASGRAVAGLPGRDGSGWQQPGRGGLHLPHHQRHARPAAGPPEVRLDARGQRAEPEAFEELSSWLAGQPLDQVKRIIGPRHPRFGAIIDSLSEYARVPPHLWIGP